MDHSRRRLLAPALAAALWIGAAGSFQLSAAPLDAIPTIDVVRSKLELTPDQEAQLVPLFERRLGQLQDTRAKLEEAASEADKRTVLRDAKGMQTEFNAQVEKLLSPSQVAKWRELRTQTREKLKEQHQDKHDDSP